jgi:hypothetical protein
VRDNRRRPKVDVLYVPGFDTRGSYPVSYTCNGESEEQRAVVRRQNSPRTANQVALPTAAESVVTVFRNREHQAKSGNYDEYIDSKVSEKSLPEKLLRKEVIVSVMVVNYTGEVHKRMPEGDPQSHQGANSIHKRQMYLLPVRRNRFRRLIGRSCR